MNFAKTCHHALSIVVARTHGSHPRTPAEELFIATAHQRLEESARMLAAMRRETVHPRTGDPTVEQRVLALDGHRRSRYTGHIGLASSALSSPSQVA